jgi:hypothetical protein
MEQCIISMPQQARAKVRGQTDPLRAQAMSLSMVVLCKSFVSVRKSGGLGFDRGRLLTQRTQLHPLVLGLRRQLSLMSQRRESEASANVSGHVRLECHLICSGVVRTWMTLQIRCGLSMSVERLSLDLPVSMYRESSN